MDIKTMCASSEEEFLADIPEIKESDGDAKINLALEEQKAYIEMDTNFTELLKNLVNLQDNKEKQKMRFKRWFFIVVMLLFVVLFASPLVIIFSFKDKITDISIITAILTSLIELVSSIIILPKIIARYLFNIDEDDNNMKIIESMKQYQEHRSTHIFKQ